MSLLSEKIKLKIPEPGKLTGGPNENFEDFEKRLRTYLCLSDQKFPTLLRWVVEETNEVTTARLKIG